MLKLYLYGEELEYSHSIEVYCFIRSKFRTLNSGVEELKENLRNTEVIDFEQYFAMLAELYASLIQVAMEESVKILYEQGMEYADEEIFYQDYHLEFECFQEALKPFAEKCDNLNKEYDLKQDLFQIEKASRSHWTGGGFGLKGAIKGAATAKMLNMGTDAFRSISDSRKEHRMSSEYERRCENIIKSESTVNLVIEALKREFTNIADCVMKELVNTGTVPPPMLETGKAKALLKNTLRFKNPTIEELKKVIVQCLRFDPFCKEIYDCLLETDGENPEVIEAALTFGMISDETINTELNKIYSMDESTWQNLLTKIKAERIWERKYNASISPGQMEKQLLKINNFCGGDIAAIDRIYVELKECFGDAVKEYEGMGILKATRMYVHLFDDGYPNNCKIIEGVDKLIEIKEEYSINTAPFLIQTFNLINDDSGIAEIVELMRYKYHQCASEEEILESIKNQFEISLYYPAQKNNSYISEEKYTAFLRSIYTMVYSATLWIKILENADICSQISGAVRNVANFLLKHTEYTTYSQISSGSLKERERKIPDSYIEFLNRAVAYVRGNSDTRFLSMKVQEFEKGERGLEQSEDKSILETVRNVCTLNADKSMMFLAVGKSLLKHKKYPKVKTKMGLLESDDVFLIYNASLFGMEGPCIVLCSSGVYMKDADVSVKVISWSEYKHISIKKKFLSDKMSIGNFEFDGDSDLYRILRDIQDGLK